MKKLKKLLFCISIVISQVAICDSIYVSGRNGPFLNPGNWEDITYSIFKFDSDGMMKNFNPPSIRSTVRIEDQFPIDKRIVYFPEILDGQYCSSTSEDFQMVGIRKFYAEYGQIPCHAIIFPASLSILSPRAFFTWDGNTGSGCVSSVFDYVVFQSDVPSGLVTSGLLLCAEKIYYPVAHADEWVSALTSANYDGQMYAFNSDRWYVDDEWNTAESVEYIRPPTSVVTVTNYVDQIVYHDFTNVIYQTQFITNVTSIVNISNIVNTIDVFHTNVVDILNPITIFNTNQIDVVNVVTSTVSEVVMTTNIVSISSIEHMRDSDVGKSQNDFVLQPGITTVARKTSSLIYDGDYCAGIVYLNIYKSSSASKVKVDGKIAFGDGKVYLITAGYGKIVDGILSVSLKSGLGQCVLDVGVNGIMGAVANKYDVLPITPDANMGTLNGNLNFRYFDKSKGIVSRQMKVKGVAISGEHLLIITDGKNEPYMVYGEKVR